VNDASCSFSPWVALYVKNRHEKAVALNLDGKGVESFLPTLPNVHASGKRFDLPLFPGYVFCRLDLHKTLAVASTPGVFAIVSSSGTPAVISDTEIEGIRRTVLSGCKIRPWPYMPPGQEVWLKSGPLKGVQGVVVDETHQKWVVLSVHLLQRSVAVKVERSQVA
jgi:transcription antitermination factor NusG